LEEIMQQDLKAEVARRELESAADLFRQDSTPLNELAMVRIERALGLLFKPSTKGEGYHTGSPHQLNRLLNQKFQDYLARKANRHPGPQSRLTYLNENVDQLVIALVTLIAETNQGGTFTGHLLHSHLRTRGINIDSTFELIHILRELNIIVEVGFQRRTYKLGSLGKEFAVEQSRPPATRPQAILEI